MFYLEKYQCNPACSDNQVCEDYQCKCQVGYYRNSTGYCGKI